MAQWPTHVAHVSEGTILSMNDMKNFPELQEIKKYHQEHDLQDSPLMALCYKWLREDREKHERQRRNEPTTTTGGGVPQTRWDVLSEDTDRYGDKYYNYWK